MTTVFTVTGSRPMPCGSLIGSLLRSICLLAACCLLLAGCVRDEGEETREDGGGGKLTLEDIKRQLDEPPRQIPSPEPTSMRMRERWKAYGRHDNPNAVEKEKKEVAEIFESQNQGSWPPEVGYTFPSMSFFNADRQKRSMEDFRGRMVLVEYVWMGSSASQALSGSNERGPFGAVPVEKRFKSLEKYFPEFSGGVSFGDVVLLQILLVGPDSGAVTPELASAWVKHFDPENRGRIVVIGTPALLRNEGSTLLGGFQLLDKNLVVRVDATRERSKTLFSELFPAIGRLKNE